MHRDFLVSSGAEIRPLSQWDLGDFFPNLKKKIPNLKKKKFFFFFRIFTHTHKLHNDNLLELHPIFLQFNLMAIVCVIANLFIN